MSARKETKTIWQTHKLDEVLQYFADGFTTNEGETIFDRDWWIDAQKGEVVFRLFIETEVEPTP